MPRTKLTDKFLSSKSILPATGQIDWFDTLLPGFGVRTSYTPSLAEKSPSYAGSRAFFVMYRLPGNSKKIRMTLKPSYPALSLKEAREQASDALRKAAAGIDPREERKAAQAAVATPETYRDAVDDYIKRYQKGRKGNATADEVHRALLHCGGLRKDRKGNETTVAPKWISRPIAEITDTEIWRHLEALRDGDPDKGVKAKPYLANRYYSYLKTFFGWCEKPGVKKVDRSPMIGLDRPWDQEASRERVFDDDELAAIWKAADTLESYRCAFVKLALLTGKRKGALAAMRWEDIDDDGVWTPPQDPRRRGKNKRTHAIVLPSLALRIVRGLDRVDKNPYVFVGKKPGQHLDPGTPLQKAIQDASGVKDFYFHAARHTVETRLAELRVAPHVRDIVLDHAPARGAGAGYDHHAYHDEMKAALEAWAGHLSDVLRRKGVWRADVEPIRG